MSFRLLILVSAISRFQRFGLLGLDLEINIELLDSSQSEIVKDCESGSDQVAISFTDICVVPQFQAHKEQALEDLKLRL